MGVGLDTIEKQGDKKRIGEEYLPKKRYPQYFKNSKTSFILLFCFVAFFVTIAYFPKSSYQIESVKINFQDKNVTSPVGWLSDYGEPFKSHRSIYTGGSISYGWIRRSDRKPLDLTKNGFKRNFPSDILLATFIAMQGKDATNFRGTAEEGIWEV